MVRRRRSRRNRFYTLLTLVFVVGGAGTYYTVFWKPIHDAPGDAALTGDATISPPLISEKTEDNRLAAGPYGHVPERGKASGTNAQPQEKDYTRGLALMKAGFASQQQGDAIDARAKLSEALVLPLPAEDRAKTRAALSKLADQTLFSSAITPSDPFVSPYVIQPGETLSKIAKRHKITSALLARVNNIRDQNRIRAGQRIKVLHGPFHALINLETFDMDVFLQETFVKHFKVGLGEDNSTPTGKWKVRNKLVNPTYYPPRGGDIIAADDPENPLGERWIGIEGVEGDALGQERYGIHGTIEPESIGRSMSLGCVRMYNEDVEFLFDLLIERESIVVVR
ncbi:MAG: LysM peptidoglycan-binding domain-containing protein [Phycisphaerae bacterium]|nr:LysM peptidoglycan-binding domain-containing protein [Phycisphaerae bacterium]